MKKNVALKININTPMTQFLSEVEVGALTKLNSKSKHIVTYHNHFNFRNHCCISFELLGKDLYEHVKEMGFKPFAPDLLKSIARDILGAIATCHSNGIIHCDVKPENLIMTLDRETHVKLADFGSSSPATNPIYSYVQSRYYRCPEIIFGCRYGTPIDMWSVGCILAELAMGTPLFPGRDEVHQVRLFTEFLGLPPLSLLRQGTRSDSFFTMNGTVKLRGMKKAPLTPSGRLKHRIADQQLLDLIYKCLEWDPAKRIRAEDALRHPYFTNRVITAKHVRSGRIFPWQLQLPDLRCR
jgi:dual specificity tyrosine-phosphorylation-regulated kinase 2/3/4